MYNIINIYIQKTVVENKTTVEEDNKLEVKQQPLIKVSRKNVQYPIHASIDCFKYSFG